MMSLAKIAEADMSVYIAGSSETRSHLTVLLLSFESEVGYRTEGYAWVRGGSHPAGIYRARARPGTWGPRVSGIAEITLRWRSQCYGPGGLLIRQWLVCI